MNIQKINFAIFAALLGYFSSFPAVAETAGIESKSSVKVLAAKSTGAAATGKEASESPSPQNEEMAQGRQASAETKFELLSLEGILSFILLSMFFLVFIKGKLLRVD